MAKQLIEPEEANIITQDVSHEVIDPFLSGKTVERDYSKASQAFDQGAIVEDIPVPPITAPNFDDDDKPNEDNDVYDFSKQEDNSKSKKASSDNDDDEDDYGFELNGETAIYLVDFLYKLFKEQYKVKESLLEKYGLSPEIFQARITIESNRMTVGQFAENYNEAMDEIGISVKDKNQIKKIITIISKKHDVKMSPEAQLLVIVGKIGLETHLQLKSFQQDFIEKLTSMQQDFHIVPEAPTPDQVNNVMGSDLHPTENYIPNSGRKRGPYRKKNKNIVLKENKETNLSEPGEK